MNSSDISTGIYGKQGFVEYLRKQGKFFNPAEKRERDLILIDTDAAKNNVYEVTEESVFHNGHYGTQVDVVFLINAIPVLVTAGAAPRDYRAGRRPVCLS